VRETENNQCPGKDKLKRKCLSFQRKAARVWHSADWTLSHTTSELGVYGKWAWLAGRWQGGVLNITAAAWTAGFHWWRSRSITWTQNVSEYMLVLALCLVMVFGRSSPYLAAVPNCYRLSVCKSVCLSFCLSVTHWYCVNNWLSHAIFYFCKIIGRVSVPRHIPTLLHGPGCNFGE